MNTITTSQPQASCDTPIRLLALPGSLRRDSFNRRLCDAAARCAPAGTQVETFDDLASIPLFSEDTEAAAGNDLVGVRNLRAAVARTDGLLIATPEYNQSIPGVLKNAIDWLSRPAPYDILAGKPVAVIGASTGPWGTRLAQKELSHVLHATGALVMAAPMLFVRDAATLFDTRGNLVDASMQAKLVGVMEAFATWTKRVGRQYHDGVKLEWADLSDDVESVTQTSNRDGCAENGAALTGHQHKKRTRLLE